MMSGNGKNDGQQETRRRIGAGKFKDVLRTKEGKRLALILVILCVLFARGMEMRGRRSEEKKVPMPSVGEILSQDKVSVNEQTGSGAEDGQALLGILQPGGKPWNLSFGSQNLAGKSRTIRVPQEATTVQQAIDEAESGDTVFVGTGQYKENILMKDGVSVVGESAATAILDGDGKGNVVTFKGVRNKDTRLENLTVRGAGAGLSGIVVEDSSPLLNRNLIRQSDYGVYIKGESSPTIQRSAISECKTGIQIFNLTAPQAARSAITDNLIFVNKKGINLYRGDALISHNTISYNYLAVDGSSTFGIYLSGSSAVIMDNIITDNGSCELCSGIYADETAHDVRIDYNDLWNNASNFVCFGKCETGEHNRPDEPGFTNGFQYDFKLRDDSPLLGAASDGGKLGARL